MEEPRWEDLQMDCLVNIFGRVGIECLLLDVPFVCKSWYKATLDPQCWKRLRFPNISFDEFGNDIPFRLMEECKLVDRASVVAFTKFVIKRSRKLAVSLKFPRCCTEEMLLFAANVCPDLRVLNLTQVFFPGDCDPIPSLFKIFERFEMLFVPGKSNLKEIVAEIRSNCKNFAGLAAFGGTIAEDEACAIAGLPNLKHLVLRNLNIEKDVLLKILQSCKQLRSFHGRNCLGIDEDDQDITKFATDIPKFDVSGTIIMRIIRFRLEMLISEDVYGSNLAD